jgi:hypothetical protein
LWRKTDQRVSDAPGKEKRGGASEPTRRNSYRASELISSRYPVRTSNWTTSDVSDCLQLFPITAAKYWEVHWVFTEYPVKWMTIHTSVRFEVFTAVTMSNAVFWDVTPCDSCKYRRFGGMYRLQYQSDKNRRAKIASSN